MISIAAAAAAKAYNVGSNRRYQYQNPKPPGFQLRLLNTYVHKLTSRASERAIQPAPTLTHALGLRKKKNPRTHFVNVQLFLSSRFLGPGFQFLSPCRSTFGHTEKCRDVSPLASELIRVIPAPPSVPPSKKEPVLTSLLLSYPRQHLRTNDLILTLRLGSFYAIRTRRATKKLSSLCMSLCELFGAERASVSVYVVLALGREREGRAAAIGRWL